MKCVSACVVRIFCISTSSQARTSIERVREGPAQLVAMETAFKFVMRFVMVTEFRFAGIAAIASGAEWDAWICELIGIGPLRVTCREFWLFTYSVHRLLKHAVATKYFLDPLYQAYRNSVEVHRRRAYEARVIWAMFPRPRKVWPAGALRPKRTYRAAFGSSSDRDGESNG